MVPTLRARASIKVQCRITCFTARPVVPAAWLTARAVVCAARRGCASLKCVRLNLCNPVSAQTVGGARLPLCGSLDETLTADDGSVGGSAIDLFASDSFYDDLSWAAAWLYRAFRAFPCTL